MILPSQSSFGTLAFRNGSQDRNSDFELYWPSFPAVPSCSLFAEAALKQSHVQGIRTPRFAVAPLLTVLLAICRPSGCIVASGVVGVVIGVVVVVGVCNRSQMRTSKCKCLIFGVSIQGGPKKTRPLYIFPNI